MTSNGEDDPSETNPHSSEPARNLFGHKAGAKPWETTPAPKPESEEAKPRASAATASAPYPDAPSYAPRNLELAAKLDDEGELTKLHPNYKLLMRFAALFLSAIIVIGALIIEGALANEGTGIPTGVVIAPAALLALFIAIRVPLARYNARGYQISNDRLRVVRGVLFHSDTVVPFGRVQHIDVDQGPIERALGIATMTLHTAGSHNASVRLPGLGHELAVEMRETIRAHIKRESM